MDRRFFSLRRYMTERRYNVKRIHKSWVGAGTGLKAVFSDLWIVFQLLLIATLYAVIVGLFPIIFYVCESLTALNAVYVLVFEKDIQSKVSWFLLFVISFGSGFLIYILSRKWFCYGFHRLRFKNIQKRLPLSGSVRDNASSAEKYLNDNGFLTCKNTSARFFPNARNALDNIIARIDGAEKFVFIEFFIVADGVLLDRLISVCRNKTAQGVKIYMLYDDVGCAGVFSSDEKKRLKSAGVKLKVFHRLFSPFYFGLNYRDHRKIVVVDGKTGYLGGFNFIDDCANQRKMEGIWKDSGIRLDGEAVDALSVQFMRQWEFATHEKLSLSEHTGRYEKVEGGGAFVPYAGGPEIREYVCRGVYEKLIASAKDRLYIMTPYLVPDSGILKLLKRKVAEGADVRVVLPGVPDYRYIYRVTQSNAKQLMKAGVKVYYAGGEFVHSKVVLSDNEACVGSVNLDMRAFYQEFDNGVLTDDGGVVADVLADFTWQFERNALAEIPKFNIFTGFMACVMRLVSPLM